MTINVSLEDAWQTTDGTVHALKDMDNKFILSCMIYVTDVIKEAWEVEQHYDNAPAHNAPKFYIHTLPDRYKIAPPVYWNMRKLLRERGWIE